VYQATLNPQRKTYYVNARTGQKTWDVPLGAVVRKSKLQAGGEEEVSWWWRAVDKMHFYLVRDQTLYWVAFGLAGLGLGVYYYRVRKVDKEVGPMEKGR
jgi:hypothetical protein